MENGKPILTLGELLWNRPEHHDELVAYADRLAVRVLAIIAFEKEDTDDLDLVPGLVWH